jgi:hypothetical protein
MSSRQMLVIGSTRHQGVKCVSWGDVSTVNIVDFHIVIINVRSVTDNFLKSCQKTFFDPIRIALSRLLDSGGTIVVLGDRLRSVKTRREEWLDDYMWSPIVIGIGDEAGTTIIQKSELFRHYLVHFQKWDYYYFLPQNCLSQELTQICGIPQVVKYHFTSAPFAENRYGKMLSGSISFKITDGQRVQTNSGEIILLPLIDELEEREALNLVLEDLGIPQITLPPEWAESVQMPLVPEIQATIDERKTAIVALNREIAKEEEKKRKLEDFKSLLYATGVELESVFATCLERCGGRISPAAYSQEEFVLDYKSDLYLVECKGVGKGIALSHIRQLFDYLTKFEEDEGRKGKGILLGNAWKDLPLADRGKEATAIFPDNVIARGRQLGITLVSSVDFFHAFCRFLAGEVTGEAILDRITSAVGIENFQDM